MDKISLYLYKPGCITEAKMNLSSTMILKNDHNSCSSRSDLMIFVYSTQTHTHTTMSSSCLNNHILAIHSLHTISPLWQITKRSLLVPQIANQQIFTVKSVCCKIQKRESQRGKRRKRGRWRRRGKWRDTERGREGRRDRERERAREKELEHFISGSKAGVLRGI